MLQPDHQDDGDREARIHEAKGDSEIRLMGDEGKLFKLLKEGPSREMKPAMIYRVMKRLTAQSNEDTEKLKSEVI